MRTSVLAGMLALVTLPACSNRVADSRQATAALRQCFVSIAPLDVPEKAKVLAPCAEKDGPALIAALEQAEPTPPQVDCHADALAGARRAVGTIRSARALNGSGSFGRFPTSATPAWSPS